MNNVYIFMTIRYLVEYDLYVNQIREARVRVVELA